MPQLKPERPRVCLFGGTFDPIHCAHLQIAQETVRNFHLDEVLFIPAGNPPHKQDTQVTPFEDRFAMVALATAPYPRFIASRLEEGLAKSFTIDTVRRLRAESRERAEFFFLIGADAFNEIESWREWQQLITLIEFIVVARPGDTYRVPEGARVQKLEGLALPVSSSSIRSRIRAGEPTPELPQAVRAFIEERGLYGFTKQDSIVSR